MTGENVAAGRPGNPRRRRFGLAVLTRRAAPGPRCAPVPHKISLMSDFSIFYISHFLTYVKD